jgi:hypothetical protein
MSQDADAAAKDATDDSSAVNPKPTWLCATSDDLQDFEIDSPLADSTSADYHEAATAFRKAAEHAETAQQAAAARIFSMLGAALDIRLTTRFRGQSLTLDSEVDSTLSFGGGVGRADWSIG